MKGWVFEESLVFVWMLELDVRSLLGLLGFGGLPKRGSTFLSYFSKTTSASSSSSISMTFSAGLLLDEPFYYSESTTSMAYPSCMVIFLSYIWFRILLIVTWSS